MGSPNLVAGWLQVSIWITAVVVWPVVAIVRWQTARPVPTARGRGLVANLRARTSIEAGTPLAVAVHGRG